MARFLRYPDLRLGRAATPRPVDDAMAEVGEKLKAAAMEVQAYGLAAAHLGEVEPLVVISIAPDARSRDYRILFNPEIVFASEEAESGLEGSVSMPGVEVPIVRANSIELVYDDAERVRQTLQLGGFAARVAQHEIDQMNGIFFLDRLSRLKRDMAIRRYNKAGAR
jgi:peptide deformylase